MLAGESNENSEKTTIGQISRKATLHVQHTFFCIFLSRCFARLQSETSRNFLVTRFLEEMSNVFLFTFFSLHRSFSPWWPPPFLIFSPPLQNFKLFLQQKYSLFSISFSVLGLGRCDHHFCPPKLGCFGRRVKQSFSDDPFGIEFGLCLFSAEYGAMIR